MRLAILGGSFNPLHIGHCMLAESVIKELNYDKILFVPTYIPPHKIMNNAISAQLRVEMLRSFCDSSIIDGKSLFEVETCEVDRGGISYTYDTLLYIIEKYKDDLEGKPAIIIGQETASQFHKWHKANEIIKIADLIVARRYQEVNISEYENKTFGNYERDFVYDNFENDFKYPHFMLNNPLLPISSTEIRKRISCDEAFRYLVPEAVFQYIRKNNLYGIYDE